jgi:hypothetical protein
MGYWKYDQHQSNTNWEGDLQSSEMVKDCDMVILETLDKVISNWLLRKMESGDIWNLE